MSTSRAEIERDCGLARSAHEAFMCDVEGLVDADRLEPRCPSRLPRWSRAHLLTHLARNADGHRRMIEGAGRGEVLEQYEGGVDGRNAGIEAGSDATAAQLLDDLRTSIDRLEAAWTATDWTGHGKRTLRGESPISSLAFLRLREVAVHHVDLGIGHEFADLDPTYVRLELRRMEMLWKARKPMGMTPVPEAALHLAPHDRLAWFMGRAEFADLEPAAIF